jgi:hypothetical protein
MRTSRGFIDRSGNAAELVDAVEAARLLGYPRPRSLPKGLLACADTTRPDADGSVGHLVWQRSTLWRYADTVMRFGDTTIDGRPALDRTGIAKHLGVAVGTVQRWLRNSGRNGFPTPALRGWYYTDDVDQWYRGRRRGRLTNVSRTGNPDDLVSKTEVALMAGYREVTHLDHSWIWHTLRQRNDPADNVPLSSGRVRLRFQRRLVWDVLDACNDHRRRPYTGRVVDHSGDPEDLVGCREAARVLGYRFPSGLPLVVLERADVPPRPRRWKRETLWMLGDELDRYQQNI